MALKKKGYCVGGRQLKANPPLPPLSQRGERLFTGSASVARASTLPATPRWALVNRGGFLTRSSEGSSDAVDVNHGFAHDVFGLGVAGGFGEAGYDAADPVQFTFEIGEMGANFLIPLA